MNINSEYIQKKEFHTAFKGYSMEEVDKFLDILSVEFDRLEKKNKELQDGLDSVKFDSVVEVPVEEKQDLSKLVSEVLVSAHKVADEIKKKAELDAKNIIENKKNIEEKEIKSLLLKKEEIEEKLKFTSSSYNEFLIKIKAALKEINLKVSEIETDYTDEKAVFENIKITLPSSDLKGKSRIDREENEEMFFENKTGEDNPLKDKELELEIKKEEDKTSDTILADFEEEKKIRQIIESDDFDEDTGRNESQSAFNREKKVFNDREEEKIFKERKKLDIANPDIINDFFSETDERKY